MNAIGDLSYTAAPNTFGTATISVQLFDDGSTTPPSDNSSPIRTFEISVTPVQDDPFFTSTAITGAVQGQPYTYNVVTTDPDLTDILTITNLIALPNWLTLVDNGDGTATLSGTPGNLDIGTEGIALNVSDNFGNNVTQFFNITVVNSNDPPYFTSTPVLVASEDVEYSYFINSDST